MSESKQESKDCFICRKHRGEVLIPGGAIFQDELIYAGHVRIREGHPSTYLGHLTIETKRHIPSLAELTDSEAQALGISVAHLSKALKEREGAEHIYAFVLGHHIPHLHVHVVPRYPGTPRRYWGVNVDEWADAPRGGKKEVEALCARLRDYLKRIE